MRRRWLLAVTVALITGWVTDAATAQPAIPNGAFVRDADRELFLVLDGQRHRVLVYPAYPDEVAAIPESGRFIVPGPEGNVAVGENPHWERPPQIMPGTTAPGLFPQRP